MNCVNCGAPPKAGADSCSYCETALDHLVEEADHDGFHRILTLIRVTKDDFRKRECLALCTGPFTAGQVREILSLFGDDFRRREAAAILVGNTTNPSGLLSCADLFHDDFRRREFVALLPRSATQVGRNKGLLPRAPAPSSVEVPQGHNRLGHPPVSAATVFSVGMVFGVVVLEILRAVL